MQSKIKGKNQTQSQKLTCQTTQIERLLSLNSVGMNVHELIKCLNDYPWEAQEFSQEHSLSESIKESWCNQVFIGLMKYKFMHGIFKELCIKYALDVL